MSNRHTNHVRKNERAAAANADTLSELCTLDCERCSRKICTGAKALAPALAEDGGQKPEAGKAKPWERRERLRAAPLWRDPAVKLPELYETVLLKIRYEDDDDPLVTSAYLSGLGWLCAVSARPLHGVKIGWMRMSDATRLLDSARASS